VSGEGWQTVVIDLGVEATPLQLSSSRPHAPRQQTCWYEPDPSSRRACGAHEPSRSAFEAELRTVNTTVAQVPEASSSWTVACADDTRHMLIAKRTWSSDLAARCSAMWEGGRLVDEVHSPARAACIFTQKRAAVCRAERAGGRGGFGSLGGP
jgi:hypothetical protein